MSFERIWLISQQMMFVVGNLVLLQLINTLLILPSVFLIAIPIIIIIDTHLISQFIYNSKSYHITNLIGVVKKYYKDILVYIGLLDFFIMMFINNQVIQTIVIEQNYGVWNLIILMILSSIIFVSTITFMIYFPLISATSEQSVISKVKITFILPFMSFRGLLFMIGSTFFNWLFIFSNMLFLILVGPILLIACNIIIFNTYINKK